MQALKRIGRAGVIGVGLVLGGLGALALGQSSWPDHGAVRGATAVAVEAAERLGALPSVPPDLPDRLEALLAGALARYALGPLGLLLLVGALVPGGSRPTAPAELEPAGARPPPLDPRSTKRARRQAAALARKGMRADAAELAFASGLLEDAARYFHDAGEFERVAEIRHDQNRFIESAELYLKARRYDQAARIFAHQEAHARAADAYLEAGNTSVAAEMFEKAGDHARAARYYLESGFPREAFPSFMKCEQWEMAATCLDELIREEESLGRGGALDPRKQEELKELFRKAGSLHERAGNPERAQEMLTRGGWFAAAAEIALRRGREEEAAELYLEAKDALRAAEIRQGLGDAQGAARILAEFHQDQGDAERAARYFEEAGDDLTAGDLYRSLELYDRAGACYERRSESTQAAEMFSLAGDRARAAQAYEAAGCFAEAAECWALAGDTEREADLLARAGQFLRAGQLHHRDGRVDAAIKVLQEVPSDGPDLPAASALLGEIFRERGMLSLAVVKLADAIGDQELRRENVGAFYELATVHESNGDVRQAGELYEKILAFDYHYADVQQRLARAREQLQLEESSPARAGADAATPMSGSRAEGRYRIVGKLGRGGMGIVYKAEDTRLDRIVAFKVLPETLKENPQALKNFLREAKSAARLNHPNIVTVYDAGEQDGAYYIAMEYVDGNTLKEIVRHRGPISAAGIVHVLAQMCEALAYAHEKKVVHRDVKTANTMWTRDRKAKVMDFGLAKLIEEVRNHTTVVSGTPYYMSPEQTLGKNVDHRTDIYSLGVTVFELATATLPFRDGNLPYHHVHTPPPDLREVDPQVPPFLAEIVAKCLQKDPARRYQSAREILAALQSSLRG